jgi:hypothetical protein
MGHRVGQRRSRSSHATSLDRRSDCDQVGLKSSVRAFFQKRWAARIAGGPLTLVLFA